MSDWWRDFLKGTMSGVIISIAASGTSVYVGLKIVEIKVDELQRSQHRLENKLDKFSDKVDKRIDEIFKDIYKPAFK